MKKSSDNPQTSPSNASSQSVCGVTSGTIGGQRVHPATTVRQPIVELARGDVCRTGTGFIKDAEGSMSSVLGVLLWLRTAGRHVTAETRRHSAVTPDAPHPTSDDDIDARVQLLHTICQLMIRSK